MKEMLKSKELYIGVAIGMLLMLITLGILSIVGALTGVVKI